MELLVIVYRIWNEVVRFDLVMTKRKVPRPNNLWWTITSTMRARALSFHQEIVCRHLRFIIIKQEMHVIVFLLHHKEPSQQAWVVVHGRDQQHLTINHAHEEVIKQTRGSKF